ncbi:hypothetical protein PI124_g12471 [Phytophthora idaei]|nr:hypothetical protein PI125_g14191 [Phytophthora idaei]KAG3149015.1 hypothetical protein PI126_g12227 [Phytophthora idaei]KAG3242682.1 hypothetical protein PI124_g12471 [Phytophthora idaei]
MCAFLNRNRRFTNVTQCKALTDEEYENAIPTSMLVDLEASIDSRSSLAEWEVSMMATLWGDTTEEESKAEEE